MTLPSSSNPFAFFSKPQRDLTNVDIPKASVIAIIGRNGSLGGEYDLVYVLVTDGLTASGGNETSYDYTVRAISNNYLSMSTDGRFTVSANEEHTAATFSISNAKDHYNW